MPKVTAITAIKCDGAFYNPGDSFDCTAAQAKQLCALGSAKMSGGMDVEPEAKIAIASTRAAARKKPKKG